MRTRFAPSPTGPLHLGHAYSALTAAHLAHAANGTFLLRIEDIDTARARPEWEDLIYDDLDWLGLDWPKPVHRQSQHLGIYTQALDKLAALGVLYPCSCNRTDIRTAATAPQEGAPQYGPDGVIYPGTCRYRPMADQRPGDALRLNMTKALDVVDPRNLRWLETGPHMPGPHWASADHMRFSIGDVVLARRITGGPAYHLAVTVDDAAQGITLVCRGQDLANATPIHVLLQNLLRLPTPAYHHHRLIRDAQGKRLAKRDKARALQTYRAAGHSADNIRRMIGF